MGLTSRIIQLATRGAAQRFEEASRNAIAVQQAKLLSVLDWARSFVVPRGGAAE